MKIKSLILFLLFTTFVVGQIPKRPVPPTLYNNFSKEFPAFLNKQEAAALEEKLEQFSNETSNQICVVVVDDLGGYDISEFAFKLGNEWGVGKADKDNGLVIVVKPTQGEGGRDLFIAVGNGLEGAIPDIAAKRVEREEIVPHFKNGEYFLALNKGTDKLMQLAKGEINVKDYARGHGNEQNIPAGVIIGLIILFIVIRNIFGGGKGGRTLSRRGPVFWGGPFGGGGWGGGSSGGGGGWGGFGGGSFGGGGAGSKW